MHVIKKTIIALFLCYASTGNAQATVSQNAIKCPSLASIHQAAPLLNQIEECKDRFCVSTGLKPAFHENGMPWGLLVPVKAPSSDEAIRKSQTTAANVGVMFSEFIWPMACIYYAPSSEFSEDEATGMIAFPLLNQRSHSALIHSLMKNK